MKLSIQTFCQPFFYNFKENRKRQINYTPKRTAVKACYNLRNKDCSLVLRGHLQPRPSRPRGISCIYDIVRISSVSMGPIRLGSEKVWVQFVLGPKRFGSDSSQKFWIRVILGPSCLTFYHTIYWAKTKGLISLQLLYS